MKMKTGLFELLTVVFTFTTFVVLSPALAGPINIKGSGTNDAKVKIDSVEGDHPSVNFLDNAKQKGVVGWYRTEDAMKFLYATTLASSNGITLKPNGNVGIGTSSPEVNLEVVGSIKGNYLAIEDSTNAVMEINSTSNYLSDLGFTDTTSNVRWVWSHRTASENNDFRLALYNGASWITPIDFKTNGNVGIGTTIPNYPLEMASGAHVTSGGVWTNASSREYKENIRDLSYEEATSALSSLKPSKFNYKVNKDDDYLGFIAEDVPDLVATKDRKGLSSMDIVAVLTKVVQQQQKENGVLNMKLAEVMSRLEALEK